MNGLVLRLGCVMSPWLFNMYMDRVAREANARNVSRRGLEMIGHGGKWIEDRSDPVQQMTQC